MSDETEERILKILYDADGSPLGLADNGDASRTGNQEASTTKKNKDRKKKRRKKRKHQKEEAVIFDYDEEIEITAANNSKLLAALKSLWKLPSQLLKWNKVKPQSNEAELEELPDVVPVFHAPRTVQAVQNIGENTVDSNINSIIDSIDANNADTISIESPPLVPPNINAQSTASDKSSFLNYFSYSSKKSQQENTITDTLPNADGADTEQAITDSKESAVSVAEGVVNNKTGEQSGFLNYFTFNAAESITSTSTIVENLVKPFSTSPNKVDGNAILIDALTKEKDALSQRIQELEKEITKKESDAIKKHDYILRERETKYQTELSNKDILNKYDTDLLKKDYDLKLKLANDMLSDYSSKYQESLHEIDNLKGKCAVLQRNCNELEQRCTSQQDELAVEKNEVELLVAADGNTKKKITFLNEEITTLRKHCGLKDNIIAELKESVDSQLKMGKQQELEAKKQLDDALRLVELAQKDNKITQDNSLVEKKDNEIKGLTSQLKKKNIEIKDLMRIIEELQGIANSVKNESGIVAAREEFEETKTALTGSTNVVVTPTPHTPSSPAKGKFVRNPMPTSTSTTTSAADPFDFSLMTSLMNVNKK